MTDNVLHMRPVEVGEAYRIDTDQILRAAVGTKFERLVIIGSIDGNDDLYVAGSANAGESIILMELAKLQIIGERKP